MRLLGKSDDTGKLLGLDRDWLARAISTSGNSTNVVQAAEMAHKMGMHVVGLTGKTGGLLAPLCHAEVRAPQTSFADRVQEIHIKVIHAWIEYLEEKLG